MKFLTIVTMVGGAMLAAALLMAVVNTVAHTYRSYRLATGTWRTEQEVTLARWEASLITARWAVHIGVVITLAVVMVTTFTRFRWDTTGMIAWIKWQDAAVVLLVSWAFLLTVLKMTAGILGRLAGKPPTDWYSRWRTPEKMR